LRQFIYESSSIGLPDWPSGTLRLEGIEVTTDPNEADVFVCPGSLSLFQYDGQLLLDKLYQLPHLKGNESRTVFFDCSDNFKQAINSEIIFIRCDVRTWMLPTDPNTIQMAWPVEDFSECVDVPEGVFKYDVSFQGWNWSDARQASTNAIATHPLLSKDIATYSDFTGYIYYEPEGIRRRAEFRRSMRESRICLCPESIPGVLPYRFFEAMSAARIPLLVGSDYVLPFADEIPYSELILTCPAENAAHCDDVMLEFLKSHTDEQIIKIGLAARAYWKKFLNRDDWPRMMSYAVEKQIKARLACA
jgi:hypothetical protein